LSFLFRPLGAIFCGYMGDRFGRRVSRLTLILMGTATALIGLLPTYAQARVGPSPLDPDAHIAGLSRPEVSGAAPRDVGGACAPVHRRSLFGAFSLNRHALGMIWRPVSLGLHCICGQAGDAGLGVEDTLPVFRLFYRDLLFDAGG